MFLSKNKEQKQKNKNGKVNETGNLDKPALNVEHCNIATHRPRFLFRFLFIILPMKSNNNETQQECQGEKQKKVFFAWHFLYRNVLKFYYCVVKLSSDRKYK
jgi:hypothetical protein